MEYLFVSALLFVVVLGFITLGIVKRSVNEKKA